MKTVFILLDMEEKPNEILGVYKYKERAIKDKIDINMSAMFGRSTQIVEHQIIIEKT